MTTKTRIVGSGFSALYFQHKPIAWLEAYTDSGQRVMSGPEPITSLTDQHPSEIAVSRVVGAGTLTVTVRELWHEEVWITMLRQAGISDQDLANINNIADAYNAIDRLPYEITAQMVITNPSTDPNAGTRGKVYHGCVFEDMADGETVAVGSLTVPRTLTLLYTHATRMSGTKSTPPA